MFLIMTIQQMVMDKYPITENEKNCLQEKQRRNNLRNIYKQRLEQEKLHTRNDDLKQKV